MLAVAMSRKPQRAPRLSADSALTGGNRGRLWASYMPAVARQCASRAASLAEIVVTSARGDFPHRATRKQDVHSGNTGASATLYCRMRGNKAGAPQMSGLLSSKSRNARQFKSRRIVFAVLCTSLSIGVASLSSNPAFAQAVSSSMQPSAGTLMTSPLAAGSTRPAGIPLGSTEIATPGISPVTPSQSALVGTCAGFDGARSSTAPFDGGGMPSLSCADSQNISSPLPSPSSIGRVGIPLGATELDGAGISPVPPVAGPSLSGAASPITDPGNP
jgi:hypothetical protein